MASNPSFHSELWAIYPAKHKTTNKPVSVFTFDKKKFESVLTKNNITGKKGDIKSIINDAYEVLRSQVSNLAKFRHPNILTIIEPLEEHKSSFIFVTEYLTNCLNSAVDSNLDDVLIQKGLLQVCNGLKFLHEQAKFIHLGIQPCSIFINENSDWKLGGLGHIQPLELEEYFIRQYDPRIPNFINISFNYTAPEVIIDSKISLAADIFSLGAVIYFLYNKSSFIQCNESLNYYKDDYQKFENTLRQNNPRQILKNIPENLFDIFIRLINRFPEQRISLDEFVESEFFNNPLVKTMTFLDEFPTKTDKEKQIFLTNLMNLLPLFPTSILSQKFLPILLDLVQKRVIHLLQISLTLIFTIGQELSQLTFYDKIFAQLMVKGDLINVEEAQIVILEQLGILQKKLVKTEEFSKFLVKLLSKTLDLKANFQIQSKSLERIDIILHSIDFPTIKNNIFPQICTIFSKTTSLTVKVKAIESFRQLIEQKGIDKFIVNDTLLPLLKSMKTRELKILQAILPVYSSSCLLLDEEEIVISVLPQLWLLSISPTLTVKTYQDYIKAINFIGEDIQSKHLQKIRASEGESTDQTELDDKEKFRHLLYGKDQDNESNSCKPSIPSAAASATLAPSNKPMNITTAHRRDNEPLVLKPKKKSSTTVSLEPSSKLTFGSNGQRQISLPVQNLRNNHSIPNDVAAEDDEELNEFDDFVSSAPSSRVTSPPPQTNGGIDWSSETNKANKPATTTHSFLQPLNPSKHQQNKIINNNYPPGFNTDLIVPKSRNNFQATTPRNNNNNNDRSNNANNECLKYGGFDAVSDSLI